MKAIASIDEAYGIGRGGKLLLHNKKDMEFFKSMTMGHPVIMGRKTFESIGKILPGRENIIISTKKMEIPGTIVMNRWEDALSVKDAFVIGGEQIYRLYLPYYDDIYLTINTGTFDADAFFPRFNIGEFNSECILQEDGFKIMHFKKTSSA